MRVITYVHHMQLAVQKDELTTFKKAFKQPKKEAAAKMENVGSGAVAAAGLHKDFDVEQAIEGHAWKAGEPVPYSFLAATFDAIAPETKRLAIIGMLTKAFRAIIELTPNDLLPAVYLCTCQVCLDGAASQNTHASMQVQLRTARCTDALDAAAQSSRSMLGFCRGVPSLR